MKITNNIYFNTTKLQQRQHETGNTKVTTPNTITNNNNKVFAYQDFNISFTGRTPEDFNRYNIERNRMPVTMKEFLMEDYEKRKNIPPQQVMEKVYEHLKDEDVKTVLDVKKKYPNEPLFNNLHEPKIKPRTSILSEIEVVKELGDTPLIKDGNDNFGLYLLKKIYLEGKSENEINKDFYENDLNEEYKGIVNKEITNADFRAYGIKFPVVPFWNSFLHTREEYKKFRIDMSQFENKEQSSSQTKKTDSSHSTQRTSEPEVEKTPRKRKYTIKKYQKDLLKRDLNNSDMSEVDIERKIRKRFSKDDPEASFIIKYLSPIMTVAADKIHLSEEEKDFAEYDKENSQKGNQTFFERFWKANPALREHYSQSITDTIEMFEDVYGGGGNIPINSNLETITPLTQNQKIIDFVSPEFIELLNYTQGIAPLREKRYAEHEALQIQWEEHFLNRYGEPKTETIKTDETPIVEETKNSVQEALDNAVKQNPGVKIYKFKLLNGTDVSLLANPKEILERQTSFEYKHMPSSFARRLTQFILRNPKATEDYLLSFACYVNNLLDNSKFVTDTDNYTPEELEKLNAAYAQEIKEQILPYDKVCEICTDIYNEFEEKNPNYIKLVQHSLREYSTKLKAPDKKYLKALIEERYRQMVAEGIIEDGMTKDEIENANEAAYTQANEAIRAMRSHDIVYLTTKTLESGLSFLSIGNDIENQQSELDSIMNKYQQPLSNSERNKIQRLFIQILTNMNPKETTNFNGDLSGFFTKIMENLKDKQNQDFKRGLTDIITSEIITPKNTTLRYLLDKNADKNLAEAIVEKEFVEILPKHVDFFKTLASLNQNSQDEHLNNPFSSHQGWL